MEKKNTYKLGLLLVAMSWGSGFPITKIALASGIQANALMALRFLFTATILFFYLNVSRIKIKKDEIQLGLGAGMILGLAFSLQTVGLNYTTASKNAFITGAYVVLVPFITWFLTKEKPSYKVYIASFLCLIGIGLLSLNGNLTINYGDFLTLLCALFFAFQMSIIGAMIKGKNSIVVNTFQMLSAGILTFILNILFENFSLLSTKFNFTQISAIGFLIVLNTLIAYLIQTTAQKYVIASTTSLILSTEVIFGAVSSVVFLGENLSIKMILGGILIFLSIILVEVKFSKNKER